MKRDPEYGVFLWWPEDDDSWIHPEDVELARKLIPGNRVFLREDFDDNFNLISYGDQQVRVRPAMWLTVEHDGYDIGDPIEIRSDFGRNQKFTGTIEEILWNRQQKAIEYQINKQGTVLPRLYSADDFQRVDRLDRVPVRTDLELSQVEPDEEIVIPPPDPDENDIKVRSVESQHSESQHSEFQQSESTESEPKGSEPKGSESKDFESKDSE